MKQSAMVQLRLTAALEQLYQSEVSSLNDTKFPQNHRVQEAPERVNPEDAKAAVLRHQGEQEDRSREPLDLTDEED